MTYFLLGITTGLIGITLGFAVVNLGLFIHSTWKRRRGAVATEGK